MEEPQKEIVAKIEDEKKYYDETTLNTFPNYASTQGEIFELIDLQSASKFRDVSGDSEGANMVFYNIVNFITDVSGKMIDVDTKNFKLRALMSASFYPAFFATKEFQYWMKDNYFARFLNEITDILPRYGNLFVKKVGDKIVWVPPQNIIARPDAKSIDYTPIIEVHSYSPDAFEKEAKDRGWENWEETLEKADSDIDVFESYFPTGIEETKNNYFITVKEPKPVVLASSYKDKNPYKHLKWINVIGRLFGKGTVESSFEEQIYLNRVSNYKAEGLHWTSLHLFQTRNPNAPRNLLQDLGNGGVLIGVDEMKPIATEERNLSCYQQEEMKWQENAYKKNFAREPISGGRAPAGTPLGSTVLQTQMAAGFFDKKQEDLASFLKEIIWDWVLPQFKSEKRKEHKILIETLLTGNDEAGDKLFNFWVTQAVNKKKIKQLEEGIMPTAESSALLRGIAAETLKRKEKNIPSGYYKSVEPNKMNLEIDIVGESVDTGSKLTTLQTVFQILGSNPTVLKDKTTRRILENMLNLAGFSPKEILPEETPGIISEVESMAGPRAERGGSLPAIQGAAPSLIPNKTVV